MWHCRVDMCACVSAVVALVPQAIEAAATLYDDYCRVITPENLLTEESEEVSHAQLRVTRLCLLGTHASPHAARTPAWLRQLLSGSICTAEAHLATLSVSW